MSANSVRVAVASVLLVLLGSWPALAWADPHMTVTEAPPVLSDNDSSNSVTVGDVLTYAITATNDGTLPLTNVQILDPLLTPGSVNCGNVTINGTCLLNGSHTVTNSDAADGEIFDNPKASATESTENFDTGNVTPVASASGAAMSVVTTLNNYVDVDNSNTNTVGDQLQVVVTATNAGSIALSNVQVSSAQGVPGSTTCATLGVGASCVLTNTYTLTAADVVPSATTTFTGSATSTQVPGPVSFTTHAGLGSGGSIDNFGLLIVSGDNQGGAPGTTLPIPLKVRLLGAGGAPVVGKAISFIVGLGSGSLTSTLVTTDALGEASTQLVLGNTPGPVGVYVLPVDSDGPSVLFKENISGLAAATTLTIVSGDGQTLVANVASAPLVVALKDASNAPVVGATINWTTSAGTLGNGSSSVTDASGQASNTITTTQAGPVTVAASSALAASPVSFSLSASLASLSNLTPEQHAVAMALDNACPALAALSSPTPEQADLLARCQDISASAGVDPGATAAAIDTLLSKAAEAQTNAAAVAIDAQIHNIQSRLIALRSGAATRTADGLTFSGPGGVVALGSLLNALSDEGKKAPADTGFSRLGFFATGNIGRGDARANSSSPGYDYDINGLTAGVDYRLRDDWVFGAALGYSKQHTDLADDSGQVALDGWSFSGYSTWSIKKQWYVDGVFTYGRNRLTLDRAIRYSLDLPGGGSTSIDQLATGKPDGTLFSGALTFGGDLHRGAWGLSPYGQVVYSRVDFDAYRESLRSGPGVGLGLAVDERHITSLAGILGTRVSWVHSASWGVLAPTASLEWDHEFRSDPTATTARFIYDPTQTAFTVSGQSLDSNYLRLGLGMTFLFTHGRSGFFLYQRTVAREGQSQGDLSLGIRIEF